MSVYFDEVVKYTLANEGSEYTDDPHDHGGPTKFGITLADLQRWYKIKAQGVASTEDVKNLDATTAADIYEAFYWEPMRLQSMQSPPVATAIFDMGVNIGIYESVKFAQLTVGFHPDLCDGIMGMNTEKAINQMDVKKFVFGFMSQVQNHYIDIVEKDNSQLKFLRGWISRSQKLLTLVQN